MTRIEADDIQMCVDNMSPLARKLVILSTEDKIEFLIHFISRFCGIFQEDNEPEDTLPFAKGIAREMELEITDDIIARWLSELGWGDLIDFEGEQLFQFGGGECYKIIDGELDYRGEIHLCKFCQQYSQGTIHTRINEIFGYACQACRNEENQPVIEEDEGLTDDNDDDTATIVLY